MSLNVAAGLGFGVPPLGAVPNLGGSIGVPNLGTQPGTARRPLTEGIPDPAAVQRQKEQYARSLEDQLRKGVEVLAATHKQQTDLLHAQANQEKHRYNIALDQQVKQRELELSQQYNEQLMRLQQAAQVQRADLEQQACGLTLEYQQKKVQEEYMAQQQGIQKQHCEAQTRLDSDIQKLMSGLPGAGANALLERVRSNVQAGNMQPTASYALPTPMLMQQPPAPVAQPGMRPYVPPSGSAPAMQTVQMPKGFQPAQNLVGSMGSLSYVPGGGVMAPAAAPVMAPGGATPILSYIPQTQTTVLKS